MKLQLTHPRGVRVSFDLRPVFRVSIIWTPLAAVEGKVTKGKGGTTRRRSLVVAIDGYGSRFLTAALGRSPLRGIYA